MKHLISLAALIAAVPALAQDYPLTITHKFGETTIEAKPERVASLDYNGADNLLALGVQPVAIRYWFGDFPKTVWPWASDLLTSEPAVLRGALDYEQIASVHPDVIVAIWSGITQEDYEALSQIAPVVAVPEGVGDYSLPWDQLALLAGRAVGEESKAEDLVASVRGQIDGIADRHPEWQGMTASVAHYSRDTPSVYTAGDIRPLLLSGLGFRTTDAVDEAAQSTDRFVLSFAEERLDMIDADLLMWMYRSREDERAKIEGLALRPMLRAHQEGREVFVGQMLGSALSHGSLISLPYALEQLEPMIVAAVDGDPVTEVPQD